MMPSNFAQMCSSSLLKATQGVCQMVTVLPILILVLALILGLLVGAVLEEIYLKVRYGRWKGRRLPLKST